MAKNEKIIKFNPRSRKLSLVEKFLWWQKNIKNRDKIIKEWFSKGLKSPK